MVCVIDLSKGKRIGPNRKAVEIEFFDTRLCWKTLDNSLAPGLDALFLQRHANAAFWFTNLVVETRHAEAHLVHGVCSKRIDVAEDQHLVDTGGCRIISEAIAGKRG